VATLASILQALRKRGWRPGGAVPEEAVRGLEKDFDVTLPADYRGYLLEAGGGDSLAPEAVTGLWPLKVLSIFNRRYRIPWNFPGLFGIGNDGFLVYALDFRSRPPVIASLGLSSSVWNDVVTDADTFVEWLERRLEC
jgi:hypothetical protein